MLFPDQVPSLADSYFSCSFLVSWASTSRTMAAAKMSYPVKPHAGGLYIFKFPESVNTSFTLLSLYGYFLKLPIRAEVPHRSEFSSRQDWVAHCHPLPTHILLWDLPCLFALAGKGGQTLTWPLLLGLVWQSIGPRDAWAVIHGFIFPFHHRRVPLSPHHRTGPYFCRGSGGASEGAACGKACESGQSFLIPVLWVGSGFASPSLCIRRELAVR